MKLRILNVVTVMILFMGGCDKKKETFFNQYKKFQLVDWAGEKFITDERALSKFEKERLVNILSHNRVVFKDTLDNIFIEKGAFYDKPEILFFSLREYVVDSNYYIRWLKSTDSLGKLNQQIRNVEE